MLKIIFLFSSLLRFRIASAEQRRAGKRKEEDDFEKED